MLAGEGFVGDTQRNGSRALCFYARVSRAVYTRQVMQDIKNTFFGGSGKSLMSFFIKEEKLSDEEITELIEMIKE